MGKSKPRSLAFAFVLLLSVPLAPEMWGLGQQATAQAPPESVDVLAGLLPQGITWQNWVGGVHDLYPSVPDAGIGPCADPASPTGAATLGSRTCTLPLNTTAPAAGLPSLLPRNASNENNGVPDIQDSQKIWMRLEPELRFGMNITSMIGSVVAEFNPPITDCGLLGPTSQVSVVMDVFQVKSGQTAESQQIGHGERLDFCPTAEGSGPDYKMDVPIALTGPAELLAGQKLLWTVGIARPTLGERSSWAMNYNSHTSATKLTVLSADALQFATWLEDKNGQITNTFPLPINPADRFSTVGFFAVKSAFGGYDDPNPTPTGAVPQPTDAKWTMLIRGPDGNAISLRDPTVSATAGEFRDCNGNNPVIDGKQDVEVCLESARTSSDTPRPSARVFRLPNRQGFGQGAADVWNYTQARITGPAPNGLGFPGGGQFKLEIHGGVRSNKIETVIRDGVLFTVGGFGIRLAPIQIGNLVDSVQHQVRPGQNTTFLLSMTNIAPREDNFTLTGEVISCSPSGASCANWRISFDGRDVKGGTVADLLGGTSSLLKVTVSPPPGGSAATIKVTARSRTSPDQQTQIQLSTQVSTTLARGAGIFTFPDFAAKSLRPGETQTFNYTVWNRGTEVDSFNVNCDQGPNLNINPITRSREDDAWNGSIAIGRTVIGCRDINVTRSLQVTLAPGNTIEAVVTVQASFNATNEPQRNVVVKVESQGDSSKVDRAEAVASLVLRTSFRLQILTDGSGSEDPQSPVSARRVLRFGKDQPGQCPDVWNPGCSTTADSENTLPQSDVNFHPVGLQKLDWNFTEYALYRITLINDGDKTASFNVRLGQISNNTLGPCSGVDSFSAVSMAKNADTSAQIGMNDHQGVLLLRRPVLGALRDVDDTISQLKDVPAGRAAVFYLRVHSEWNRYNLSQLSNPTGVTSSTNAAEGEFCESISVVNVQVTAEGFPAQTVRAETLALNVPLPSDALPHNVVVTEGIRSDASNLFETDFRQTCTPVTPADSPDKLFCKYVKPGQIDPRCDCSVSWFFTAAKFASLGDAFIVRDLTRVGGLSLVDLRNRGWDFKLCDAEQTGCVAPNISRSITYASGDELALRVDVKVPGNATVTDFAGLDLQVATRTTGASSRPFAFYTIGAQKFQVGLTPLTGGQAVQVHPGDRAAIPLNVSNGGAAVDNYNITLMTQLPQGWTVTFQPNETRVSPSHNKTVTVFINTPRGTGCNNLPSPSSLAVTIRARSTINLSEVVGETFNETAVTVQLVPCILNDNVAVETVGSETRPINPGGSLTFTLNITNPSPQEKKFVLRRLPASPDPSAPPLPLVDGWTDLVGEPCFDIPAKTTKQVSFTTTAAIDALEGTYVTYVLRVDEANTQCLPRATSSSSEPLNFAQALVTATVIGQVGFEIQPLAPSEITAPDGSRYSDVNAAGISVVPRGGSARMPVRVRNVGTAGDTFFFQAVFANQSQALGPNPWTVDLRRSDAAVQPGPIQSLFVDPQTSIILFVNITAPLNIPTTGVRSDLDFTVRGTQASPASARLTAFVQDYDLRIRLSNASADAFPGQSLFFTLNMTNAGNGPDKFEVVADVGGLAGFWNVTTDLDNLADQCGAPRCIRLLNGTSKDVQIAVQVPKSPLPTTGAIIGLTVRSRQVESLRPVADSQVGAGSPLVSYLNQVAKTSLISVNLFPYVSLDVDGDHESELAVDRDRNPANGFELFVDPFTQVTQSVDLLAADGDDDGKIDHFIDTNLDGRPDRYWDPDNGRLTAVGFFPDLNNDGTLEYLYDSDADLAVDHWIDPATRRTGEVIEKDFDDDGNPEFLIDTNGDGRPDKYFDPDRGPRGLVTNVEPAPSGNPQQYSVDTNGGGRPTKIYDRVTGEVTTASFASVGGFLGDYWYLVLLFLIVAGVAGYMVYQRRRGPGS